MHPELNKFLIRIIAIFLLVIFCPTIDFLTLNPLKKLWKIFSLINCNKFWVLSQEHITAYRPDMDFNDPSLDF